MDPVIQTILYICGIITSVSAAAAVIAKVIKKAMKKLTEETIKETISVTQKSIDDKIENISKRLSEYMERQEQNNEHVRKTLLANTRDRINQAHEFYMKKQMIGAHSLFTIEELYASYKELGGNSFIDRQMEDIRDLEVVSAETILK